MKRLPEQVWIDGMEHPIQTDFRAAVDFEVLFFEKLTDLELLQRGLEIFYGDHIPHNEIEAARQMMWFYTGGEKSQKRESSGKIPYSFSCDTDYIFAAFLDQYGIDLWTVDYLHWWQFRAMFKSLKEDNRICEIMMYRTIKIDSGMPKDRKAFYRKMQKLYAIPKTEKQLKAKDALEEALMNGGDIRAVLGGEY